MVVSFTPDKTCTGYQISYSTSKKFAKSKTKTVYVTKKTSKSKTIKKLTSKKVYYVRMRQYKTINGKKYFGKYSVTKKVKVL